MVVVLGHRPDTLQPVVQDYEGASWIINPDYAQGKTTSIKAGLNTLNAAEMSVLLLLNVDQPRSASTIRHAVRYSPKLLWVNSKVGSAPFT